MKQLLPLLTISVLSVLLYNCTSVKAITSYNNRRMILRDEAISQLSYEDLANPQNNWYVTVPAGRDLQLVGNGNILIGTGTGYEIREIATGKKVSELTSYPGTIAARRLRNGHILLVGENWQGRKGVVLLEVNESGIQQHIVSYAGFDYARLARETTQGSFMVCANDTIFEGDVSGNVLWKTKVQGPPDKPHVWQAMKLADGHVIASCGYSKNLQLFSKNGTVETTITGPADVTPNFYGGFQILSNGHYVVTNWQGHGPGHGTQGVQLLEYSKDGKLVWSWKQDPQKYSSVQGIIVLDGLNTNLMYTEDDKGMLAPVGNRQ